MKSEHVKQCGELGGKEGEREREQQISGALDRSGVGVGKKWPLENLNT